MFKYHWVLFFLIGSMFACDSSPRKVEEGEVVNIYTNTLSKADQSLFSAFERASGVKVNIISDAGNRLIKRLTQQDSMQADLILLEGLAFLQQAKQSGLLDTLSQGSIVNAIPHYLRDQNLQWLSIGYSANVIAYLRDSVDTLQVRQYANLADPQWQGKVGWGTKKKAFYQSQLAAMLADRGEAATRAWINAIAKNSMDTSSLPPVRLYTVSDSSAWLSLLNTAEYAEKMRINTPKTQATGLIFPLPEAYIHITGVGLAQNAPHPARARALLTYLFSRDLIQEFTTIHRLFPARPDVEAPASLRHLDTFSIDTTSQTQVARYSEDAERLLNSSGW